MALQAEGEHPALPGRGRGQLAEASAAVPGAGVSPLQEADAPGPPQPGAGPGSGGERAGRGGSWDCLCAWYLTQHLLSNFSLTEELITPGWDFFFFFCSNLE